MTRARDLADYISTGVSDTELDVLDGVTAGTVTASKALVVDANKDIASLRNITATGTITGTVSTAAQTNITSLGTLTALTVDDITIDGSTISDGGDFTIDSGGDIILDANGADWKFKDDGTDVLNIENSSGDIKITSITNDKDIIFRGVDNGSAITALTLDMSAAGEAKFHRPRSNTAGDCALTVDPSDTIVEYGFRIDTANNAFNIDRVDNTTNLFSISAVGDASFAEELIAKSYNETYVSLSAASSVTIDCHTGNVFALTTNQNTTFTFSNPPASGTAYGFTLKLTAGGGHTITYPNSVDFAGGTAPDAPASGETDVLVFITVDGGTNWYGALAIDAAG